MPKTAQKTDRNSLYIVATPIGNLSDISLRAIEVLKSCDMILCEDTRVSRKLLDAHNITTPLRAYHDHNGEKLRPKIIEELVGGRSIALISDAGTPLISDPGYKLVGEAQNHNIRVTPIPGASAFLAALSASGLPTDKFIFLGFLPAKKTASVLRIEEHISLDATQIYYETAPRLLKTLQNLQELCPERVIVIARELTKAYEEILKGTASHLIETIESKQGGVKGEIVLLIAPAPEKSELGEEELSNLIKQALKTHSVSDASKMIAKEHHMPRKKIYDMALKLSKS